MLLLTQKCLNNTFIQNSANTSFQVTVDLLNSENLKVAVAQLYKKLQFCNFAMLQLIQKYVNNILKENILNPIVFKF